jgi:hypothetical protein
MLLFDLLLRSVQARDSAAIFTARTWPWALHAAACGLSREKIEHEILNDRDPPKKDSRSHRFDYRA